MTWRCLMCLLTVSLLTQCDQGIEKEREIGYLGKARTNPFLAMERFVERQQGCPLVVQSQWPNLDETQSMIFFSTAQLSTRIALQQVGHWVEYGGHAVILLDRDDVQLNDWRTANFSRQLPAALIEWTNKRGLQLKSVDSEQSHALATFRGRNYQVEMGGMVTLHDEKDRAQPVISREMGDGTVTWITDASMMRNRWIDQKQHIDLICDLLNFRREGSILLVRGAGISFWGLLWLKGWTVLLGIAVAIASWLLTHLPRFGPMQSELRDDQIRAYDHHLQMIGDFHWRTDRCASLIEPLRTEAHELCYHWQLRHGRLDERLFDVMVARAQLPADRVERAMTDPRARDPFIFTRIVADLQSIRKAFL